MIVYLDTSAFVALVISEPTSPACRRVWNDADTIVSSRLLYVESAAALAMARRLERLAPEQFDQSLMTLDELWSQFDIADVDQTVVDRAAVLTHLFPLRGYDAVHCASAEQLRDEGDPDDDLVAVSGDRRLLDAWTELGVSTFDPSSAPETDDTSRPDHPRQA